jgi:hypothetical protein
VQGALVIRRTHFGLTEQHWAKSGTAIGNQTQDAPPGCVNLLLLDHGVCPMRTLSRRQLLRLAVALPCAGLFSRYRAPHLNRVKITGIQAMAIKTSPATA